MAKPDYPRDPNSLQLYNELFQLLEDQDLATHIEIINDAILNSDDPSFAEDRVKTSLSFVTQLKWALRLPRQNDLLKAE